jgi:hypothetical protein
MERASILLVGLKHVCRYLAIMIRVFINDGGDYTAAGISAIIQEALISYFNFANSRAHLFAK